MSDKFDVKDFFNYLIAGILWLLLFWQIDDVFNRGHFFSHLSQSVFFENDIAAGVFSLVIAFVTGVLLRPMQALPICVFNVIEGKPIGWVLGYKNNKIPLFQRMRSSLLRGAVKIPCIGEKIKEILNKFFYFLCLDKNPLSEDEIASVKRYFNLESDEIDDPKGRLDTIETRLRLEYPQIPLIFDKMKNYQNLVESIMTPTLANIGILLFDRTHLPCRLKILLFVVAALATFNCYQYYKSEYYKGVFRSVPKLAEVEKKNRLSGAPVEPR